MAQIPRKYIDNYTNALNGLSADVQKKLSNALAMVDFSADVADVRNAVIDIMELHLGPYTDMAAVLAAEVYDGLREMEVGKPLGAYADSGRESIATGKAVRGIMQDVVEGKAAEVVIGKLLGRADYEIKRAAGECMYRNGKRDPLKPRFARVPSGSETCKFCIMLASRGFVYRNEKTAGEDGHYHANCDCRIVPGFGDNPSVAGYDPDKYYKQYRDEEAKRTGRRSGINAKMSSMEHNESLVKISKNPNSFSVSKAVNTYEFHDAFGRMPVAKPVSESLYVQAGRILSDIDGTEFERLVAVGARSGKLVADNFDQVAYPRKSKFSKEAMSDIANCEEGVILIHNHPGNTPPSYADIITAAAREDIVASVVVGHDGGVWYFSISDTKVATALESYYNDFKDYFGDYAEVLAVKQLLEDNEKRHLFEWEELR